MKKDEPTSFEHTEYFSAEWLRYEARVLLCEVAPLRSMRDTEDRIQEMGEIIRRRTDEKDFFKHK